MTSLISIHFSGQPPCIILNYLYYQYIICMDDFCYVFSTGKKFYSILFYSILFYSVMGVLTTFYMGFIRLWGFCGTLYRVIY